MEYMTTVEMSKKWNITSRRIGVLCSEGRIEGVIKKGKTWLIPADAVKPVDQRINSGKYIKSEKYDMYCETIESKGVIGL